jgi:hypothetical protein
MDLAMCAGLFLARVVVLGICHWIDSIVALRENAAVC